MEPAEPPITPDPALAPEPPKKPSYRDAILLNIAIILFGLVAACMTQFVIAPVAIAASFALGIGANMGSNSEAFLLLIGFNLLFNLIAFAIVAAIALLVKRLWLLQGWIIGALIGFLLYSACFGMIANG